MSSGSFVRGAIYQDDFGNLYPIRVQPETLTLTIGGVANTAAAGPLPPNLPTVSVSRGRQANGVNARLVRIEFTTITPPGYANSGTIALPVLTQTAFAAYSKDQVGMYSLNGVDYDVRSAGRTTEKIN